MDTRIALEKNTVLTCGGGISFIIRKEIARGGSCIVYDAVYEAGGEEKPVRLKECYPFNLEIRRLGTGALEAGEGDAENFEKAKAGVRRAFREGNGLFLTKGLTNAMSNMLHCFEENNTVYIPSVYLEGETLNFRTFSNLKDCVSVVKAVAQVVKRIHQAGYLYLDIKPGNVFVLTDASGKGATELVQLFDFDSLVEVEHLKEGEAGNFRLSYTPGFAALEHQLGKLSRIGFYTDVYSVGALLFYLVFGMPPYAVDCEEDAVYDFGKSKYGDTGYQDRLFQKLTEFFHRTLANYRYDRYQTMGETVEKLGELVGLADRTVPYVLSTAIIPGRCFIGREAELLKLREWAGQEKSRCLFLTGMGGIGKSSLVRKFLFTDHEKFDTVLYLYFQESIQKLITDDNRVQINTVEQGTEENQTDYFKRKLRSLKKLLHGKKAVLVIDDFCGEITEDFLEVLDVGWKILVLSRTVPPSDAYAHISLEALQEREELYQLFEQYAGLQVGEEERRHLDRLIERVEGHTLALELIARQIKKSRLTLAEAERLAERSGFSSIGSEKVRFEKDNRTKTETIQTIISAVFLNQGEEPEKKRILKALSLFGHPGVPPPMFMEMLELPSLDSINDLKEEGWLAISEEKLSMHPVIRETVALWGWEKQYQADAGHIMEYLYVWLKLEADWAEYPLSALRRNEYLKTVFESDAKIGNWLRKCAEKEGVFGKVLKECINQSREQKAIDHRKVRELLQLSESILESCRAVEVLRQTDIWKELLGKVLLSMPVERETYIIRNARILMEDPACKTGEMMMRLCKKLLSVYLEQYEIREARELLEKVRRIVRGNSHFVKAQYYDMLADYYDACLDGKYETDDEGGNRKKLLQAVDKSVFHMNLARGGRRKSLLIEYTLNKANVLIRSTPEKKAEIEKLLNRAGKWTKEDTQIFSRLRWSYFMSLAWYYTLTEPDEEKADLFCQSAAALVSHTCETELEYIDIIVIPHANMLAELNNPGKAKEVLSDGIQICDKYPEMLPYIRKKRDLYGYLLEICYYAQDREVCRKTVTCIEEESEHNWEMGITGEIPEEVRRFAETEK